MGEGNFGGANGSASKGGHTEGLQGLLSGLKCASGTQPVAFTLGPECPVLPVLCIGEANGCQCK